MTAEYVLALCMSEQEEAQGPVSGVNGGVEGLIRRHNISCTDRWCWDGHDEVTSLVCDDKMTSVTFHPHWSNGTAAIRASEPLTGAVSYWEIHVGDRVFGTSLMFGVTTKAARLRSSEFKNLIGEDVNGWGLSHRGHLYHNGVSTFYCKPFKEYTPVVVGILVDRDKGEMTYFKDGVNLGVAFRNLDRVKEDLYPTVSSTAAKTSMTVGVRLRTFTDLQDRCRQVINRSLGEQLIPGHHGDNTEDNDVVARLPLPVKVQNFLKRGVNW